MALFRRLLSWLSAPFRDEPVRRKRIARRADAPAPEAEAPADPTAPWERGRAAPCLQARAVRRHVMDVLHQMEVEARTFDDRALLRRLQGGRIRLPPIRRGARGDARSLSDATSP